MVKDGLAVETRYKAQFRQAPKSPQIWVFMNEVPPLYCLSKDRWNLYMVHPVKKELITWSPGTMKAVEMKHKEIEENKPILPKKQRLEVGDASDLFYFLAGEGEGETKRERVEEAEEEEEEEEEGRAWLPASDAINDNAEESVRRSLAGLGGEGGATTEISSSSSTSSSSSINTESQNDEPDF